MSVPVALRPLPTRITPHAFLRLQEQRARDGLSVQEHVRRAIDEYLDRLDGAAHREAAATARSEATAVPGPPPPGKRKHPLPIHLQEAADAPQKSHQRGKSKVTFR